MSNADCFKEFKRLILTTFWNNFKNDEGGPRKDIQRRDPIFTEIAAELEKIGFVRQPQSLGASYLRRLSDFESDVDTILRKHNDELKEKVSELKQNFAIEKNELNERITELEYECYEKEEKNYELIDKVQDLQEQLTEKEQEINRVKRENEPMFEEADGGVLKFLKWCEYF